MAKKKHQRKLIVSNDSMLTDVMSKMNNDINIGKIPSEVVNETSDEKCEDNIRQKSFAEECKPVVYDDIESKEEQLIKLSSEKDEYVDKLAEYIEENNQLKEEISKLKEEIQHHLSEILVLSSENEMLKNNKEAKENNTNVSPTLISSHLYQEYNPKNVYYEQLNKLKRQAINNGYTNWN